MPPPHSSSSHPLRIVPKELVFPAPLNRVITNILKLQNVTQSPIAYKVKTTAPQRYCVRPNNGILPPGETIEVQVLLNYVKDAPPNLDIKDKFQIQSIILQSIPANPADVGEVWARATNEQITKQKLKSRFTAATSNSNSSSNSNLNSKPATNAPSATSQEATSHESGSGSQNPPLPTIPSTTTTSTISTPATTSSTEPYTLTPQPPIPEPITPVTAAIQALPSFQQAQQQQALRNSSTQLPQHNVAEKKSLGESSDIYSTPVISSIAPEKSTDNRSSLSKLDSQTSLIHDTPKPTGDYVVDTVANFSRLRQSLEQVAALKSEKEGMAKENQRLNDQVKLLVDQLQRAKDEGLRHRGTPGGSSHNPPALVSTKPDIHSQQMLIQIQTKVLLIVVLFFAFVGFLLGRLTSR